jgi:hypothetical protein
MSMLPRDSHYDSNTYDTRLRAIFIGAFIAGLCAIAAAWIATGLL